MASSTLLTVSLAMLVGAHAVGGAHLHPPRSGPAMEAREDGEGTFSIRQTRNVNYKGKPGLEAMIDVYKKYGVELTPQLKKAVQINNHISTSLKSSYLSSHFHEPLLLSVPCRANGHSDSSTRLGLRVRQPCPDWHAASDNVPEL